MSLAPKIAIIHGNPALSADIARIATASGLIPTKMESAVAEHALADPAIAAIVLDVADPSCGFEFVEMIGRASSGVLPIVVSSLDAKTLESVKRLAETKQIRISICAPADIEAHLPPCFQSLVQSQKRFAAKDLNDALAQKLVRVLYQPKVPLDPAHHGELAVEALCRIDHPEFGAVPPDCFIALAEQAGIIGELTDTVVHQSFADWKMWRDHGLTVQLAINVSPMLLANGDWARRFLQSAAEADIDLSKIILEVTETVSGAATAMALETLTFLRLKGLTLSIDDFGTGFSSLSTLYQMPFGELKIDKSFTSDVLRSGTARSLIESTIAMAKGIGLKVTAEGVESEAVFDELRLLGCDNVQGYYISRAVPAGDVLSFAADWRERCRRKGTGPSLVPKIAIIQSILSDILQGRELGSTVILSHAGNIGDGRESSAVELVQEIPSLVLQQRSIAALVNCQAALRKLEQEPGKDGLRQKIADLQQLIEAELLTICDIEIACGDKTFRLLRRRQALIGRPSTTCAVDVAAPCGWFSRGDRNLRVFDNGGGWAVEDLGSTNGSIISRKTLAPGRSVKLPLGETIVSVGKEASALAPVRVKLRRPLSNPDALVVQLLVTGNAGTREIGNAWPSCEQDLRTTWILYGERFRAGTSKGCAMTLETANADIAAEFYFDRGLWVAPVGETEIAMDGLPIAQAVPLPIGAELTIGEAKMKVREILSQEGDAMAAAARAS